MSIDEVVTKLVRAYSHMAYLSWVDVYHESNVVDSDDYEEVRKEFRRALYSLHSFLLPAVATQVLEDLDSIDELSREAEWTPEHEKHLFNSWFKSKE